MKIHLIDGYFSPEDALSIITEMIGIKIRFQEEKIKKSDNEEDIKMREARIKSLQADLFESRRRILERSEIVSLQSEIHFI